jgi:hypothetical protein
MADDLVQLQNDLLDLGMEITGTWQGVISGLLPIDKLDQLARIDGVNSVQPFLASTSVGLAMSQGDAAQGSDDLRTAVGLDGGGVIVGAVERRIP